MTEMRKEYLKKERYFMATAILTSKRSKDPATQVGACIVNERDEIIGLGHNAFPRGCKNVDFPWGDSKDSFENKKTYVLYAVPNAMAKTNGRNLEKCTIYTTLHPSNHCAKLIIQAGIKEVVYLDCRTSEEYGFRAADRMFKAAGVETRAFKKPTENIVIDWNDRALEVDLK